MEVEAFAENGPLTGGDDGCGEIGGSGHYREKVSN